MLKADSRECQVEREAKKWAESTCDLNPRNRKTWTYEEKPFCPKVEVYEKYRSTEESYNIPEVYVWLQLDEKRHRQYRCQRVYHVIHQLAYEEHCEHGQSQENRDEFLCGLFVRPVSVTDYPLLYGHSVPAKAHSVTEAALKLSGRDRQLYCGDKTP
jgi:hypothetical protein